MTVRQSHWLEKLTVEVAVVAALAAGYFVLYPLVRQGDAQTATALLPVGGLDRLGTFALGLVVLGIACGLLTIPARPCGTILVIVTGAGAVALRSPEFRTLLWLRQDNCGSLFRLLMAETLLLGVALGAAVLMMGWARALASRVLPRLAWRPMDRPGPSGRPPGAPRVTGGLSPGGRSVVSAAMALLVGLAALTVLLQSSQRGQVLFALVASFTVAVWVAQRLLPAPHVEAYLFTPLAAGLVLYALASVGSYGASPEAWTAVPLHARVLPVDWLTAGCGGAMLGCWTGQRMHEAKLLDRLEEP